MVVLKTKDAPDTKRLKCFRYQQNAAFKAKIVKTKVQSQGL